MKLRDLLRPEPLRVVVEETLVESMQRHCDIYKAADGKWYMELADAEDGEQYDSTAYGPFYSSDAAVKYLDNFSNPGGYGLDDSGERPAPTSSPNGAPLRKPTPVAGSFNRYRY